MSHVADFETHSAADLLAEFDEGATLYPAGVVANATSVAGVFDLGDTEQLDDKGRYYRTTAELTIADTVTVDNNDRWLINGEIWNTVRNGKPQAGLRKIYLTKTENESRTSGGRTRGGR